MLKQDLRKLKTHKGSPCISIIAPMYKVFPDIKKNPIVLKNLIKEAEEKLLKNMSAREASPFLKKIEQLESSINYESTNNGIAIFVSPEIEKVLHLPFKPEKQAIVDTSFQVRDLVFNLNRTTSYYVLCLSLSPTRLLIGHGSELEEVNDSVFPAQYAGPERTEAFNKMQRVDMGNVSDEYVRNYFRIIDKHFIEIMNLNPLPLFLLGISKNISNYRGISKLERHFAGTIEGNHVQKNLSEISEIAWPVVQDYNREIRLKTINDLQDAVGKNKYVSGLQSTWQVAVKGNIETLMVEENYSVQAYLNSTNNHGLVFENKTNESELIKLEDAVDDLIELVLSKGGNIRFFKEGKLGEHGKVAAITRY